MIYQLDQISNNILKFAEIINMKEVANKKILLYLSERIFNTIPEENKQYHIRNALQIYYLIRNSPYRDLLLEYFGYNQLMQFNLEQFKQNYGNGFLHIPKENEKLTKSESNSITELQSQLIGIKDLIQHISQHQPLDNNSKLTQIIEQTKTEMDNFLTLLSDPTNFEGIDIKDILQLFSDSIQGIKQKME